MHEREKDCRPTEPVLLIQHLFMSPIQLMATECIIRILICHHLFLEHGKIQLVWYDKGKGYYNKSVRELLEKNNITLYSTENEEKSSVCERWNRTIETKMWKQFTVQGNTVYLDILPKILSEYNNTKHSSIKMTPVEVVNSRRSSKKKNENTVYFNLYGDMKQLSSKAKFKIGDKVRIS